jgi:hypothetical protein
MTTTNYTRSAVATLANALHYQQGFTLSAAWTKAWKVIKLKAAMREGTANFTYTKKDGTSRPAVGTTAPALTGYTQKPNAPKRNYSPLYVRYFDTTADGFRQFAAAALQ